MRALTVRQPCASALAHGLKPVENRTKPPPSTVPLPVQIAIHAGLADHGGCWDLLTTRELVDIGGPDLPRGALIATAWLRSYHHADDCDKVDGDLITAWPVNRPAEPQFCSRFAEPDRYHWLMDHPVLLPAPIPMRGRLGLWVLPNDLDLTGATP